MPYISGELQPVFFLVHIVDKNAVDALRAQDGNSVLIICCNLYALDFKYFQNGLDDCDQKFIIINDENLFIGKILRD